MSELPHQLVRRRDIPTLTWLNYPAWRIACLATKADVPILPLGISGPNQMLAEWKRLRRPRIVVRFGQLFRLEPVQGRQKVRQLQERSDEVMRRIAALVNEDLRGVYTDSVRELEPTA